MRVRFVTSLDRGGPIEHTLGLAAAMHDSGIDVGAVCVSDEVADRFCAAGADAAVIPLRSWRDAQRAREAWRYVRGADVVHGQDRRSGLWVRLGPRPRRRGLRIYTMHGLPDEYLPIPGTRHRPGARATIAYRGLDAGLCRRADAVIVPSAAFAELIAARLGYPRRKLVVIPHGVSVPAERVTPGAMVGTMALLEPVKGLDVLLRAAARLASEDPGLRFAIFGDGPERGRLESLAAQLGIADRVDFPGYVAKAEALGRLAVFVVSSYVESGPLTLLEAMAAGVPVVSTKVGAVSEIVTPGTAQLVPIQDDAALAEAIAGLIADPALRKRQARAARERVLDRFTMKACAEETLGLYERLLGET